MTRGGLAERERPTLPEPRTLPVRDLPRFLLTVRHNIIPAFNLLFARAGSPSRLSVPGVVNLVFVNRPQDAEQILVRKQDVYSKGPEYDVPALGLREGLVTSRGEKWARDRAMLNPMFARRHLAPFATTMVDCVDAMLERWDQIPDGARIEVQREMMELTLDIAARTMFGTSLTADEVERTGVLVAQVLEDILRVGNSPLMWGAQALPGMSVARAAALHWRGMRIKRRVAESDELLSRYITERAADPDGVTDDLLGLLLAARDGTSGDALTMQEVIEQSGTFLGAGHETTATGTTWLWHLLSKNVEARDRMVAEVDTVLDGRRPTFEDVDNLPWTKACFSEGMRLHPPVYLSMRTANQDDDLNGFRITKGSIMLIVTHMMHRDETIWPDPMRFDPERFMPGAPNDRPKSSYLPFGGGRRLCIGSQFAMMEATIMAARTVQRFLPEAIPGRRVVEHGATTLRPRGGLPMILRRRTDAPALVGSES